MKPRAFDYVCAKDLSDVASAFAAHDGDALILAGGQSLIPALNLRLTDAAVVIDISRIDGLDKISHQDGTLHIGPICRHETVRTSEIVIQHAPLIAEALAHVAYPAIRNRGTIGGSLCNADPSAELPACMVALGATLSVAGSDGTKEVAAKDFFLGLYETCLEPGDLLTGISLPAKRDDEIHFFDEIARRRGDYALAGLAARARVEAGRLVDPVFAFLSCDEKPALAEKLSRLVAAAEGNLPDSADIAVALELDLNPPQDDVTSAATRLHLAGVLVGRALAHLTGEARQ